MGCLVLEGFVPRNGQYNLWFRLLYLQDRRVFCGPRNSVLVSVKFNAFKYFSPYNHFDTNLSIFPCIFIHLMKVNHIQAWFGWKLIRCHLSSASVFQWTRDTYMPVFRAMLSFKNCLISAKDVVSPVSFNTHLHVSEFNINARNQNGTKYLLYALIFTKKQLTLKKR